MVSFAVTLDDQALQRALTGLIAVGSDMKPAMDEIGAVLTTSTQRRFEEGKDPGGKAWKPSLRAGATGGLTLVDSGHLRDSITWKPDVQSVEVGTNLVYARIHQLGGKAGRAKSVSLPARPFLGLSAGDEENVLDILVRFIERRIA